MKLYTIGFTRKSAEQFFGLLERHGVERVIDIRLHSEGQLSGFAKGRDLAYFLPRLIGCEYTYRPDLAPSEAILADYRRNKDWGQYASRFESLLDERGIPDSIPRDLFFEKTGCLLCGEPTPERCHRRLVAERVAARWPDLEVVHIL